MVSTNETTEAPTEATENDETAVVESAQEQLERIETEYKATRKTILAAVKTESKTGVQAQLDEIAGVAVDALNEAANASGMKINNFTIRFKAGDVIVGVEAVEAVKADKKAKIEAVEAVEAVEGVNGINTVLNVVRQPKNSPVTTVVEGAPEKTAEVQAAAAAKADEAKA